MFHKHENDVIETILLMVLSCETRRCNIKSKRTFMMLLYVESGVGRETVIEGKEDEGTAVARKIGFLHELNFKSTVFVFSDIPNSQRAPNVT